MQAMGHKTVCTVTFQCHNPDGTIVCLPCQRSRVLAARHNGEGRHVMALGNVSELDFHFRLYISHMAQRTSVESEELFLISIRRTINEGTVKGN
jgi:hypothetical protein